MGWFDRKVLSNPKVFDPMQRVGKWTERRIVNFWQGTFSALFAGVAKIFTKNSAAIAVAAKMGQEFGELGAQKDINKIHSNMKDLANLIAEEPATRNMQTQPISKTVTHAEPMVIYANDYEQNPVSYDEPAVISNNVESNHVIYDEPMVIDANYSAMDIIKGETNENRESDDKSTLGNDISMDEPDLSNNDSSAEWDGSLKSLGDQLTIGNQNNTILDLEILDTIENQFGNEWDGSLKDLGDHLEINGDVKTNSVASDEPEINDIADNLDIADVNDIGYGDGVCSGADTDYDYADIADTNSDSSGPST